VEEEAGKREKNKEKEKREGCCRAHSRARRDYEWKRIISKSSDAASLAFSIISRRRETKTEERGEAEENAGKTPTAK